MSTTRSGKATSTAGSSTSRARQILRDHHQRHVADHLGGRRHLHDVAEHLVHVGIGVRDLVPALLEPERARLLLEVGELPARHLMQIDFGRAGALSSLSKAAYCARTASQ